MTHKAMTSNAEGLAERGIATLRFNFPYMEKGSKRPDAPKLAHAAIRAAAEKAGEVAPDLPLFAGGRSFGGRMTSQAQAISPLPGIRGLVFLGFPLHPAGRPGIERADHLADVKVPMLFVSGSRDALGEIDAPETGRCGPWRIRDASRRSSTPTIRSRWRPAVAERAPMSRREAWMHWRLDHQAEIESRLPGDKQPGTHEAREVPGSERPCPRNNVRRRDAPCGRAPGRSKWPAVPG